MRAVTSFADSLSIFMTTYSYLQKSKRPSASVDNLKIQWAQDVLSRLKVDLEVAGSVSDMNSLLFVGNHISYLDIPLLMSAVRGLSFVAKKEISSWPIIGSAATRVETVYVKRENGSSRAKARQSIADALLRGQRVALFPSGTTCVSEKKEWRRGAFEIAADHDLFIQPFRISYYPLRAAAYIDDDFLPTHLYNLFGLDKIQAKIEFHEPVKVSDVVTDCAYWQNWSRALLSHTSHNENSLEGAPI